MFEPTLGNNVNFASSNNGVDIQKVIFSTQRCPSEPVENLFGVYGTATHTLSSSLAGRGAAAKRRAMASPAAADICSYATLDLTMCAACKPTLLSPRPRRRRRPGIGGSVVNGLKNALDSRTLNERTNERARPWPHVRAFAPVRLPVRPSPPAVYRG